MEKYRLDDTPPEVTGKSPGAWETLVSLGSTIVVTFNEPVECPAGSNCLVVTDTRTSLPVPGDLMVAVNDRLATFTPDQALTENTQYDVSADFFKDLGGIPMATASSWSFTT